ncbi:YqgE/AlgH family protein [Allopusillimonas ginsengisoli]|uniref:YqgE/AlgH family protein n=1 Tax=Allopusillimonas ginsengisoli TaxID=453575 RepID=UPI001021D82E|nr:YqgE/AlgH family protein [Allopusillimonas ginsengisoli]TEA79101.1 YqgE/AlgH family protein [Allopusillimonas ginsengisoli]
MSTTPKRPQPHVSVDLSRQLLVAMPGRVTGELANTVIYVCEHTGDGALGLVINRPTDITVADLLKRIDLDLSLDTGDVQDALVFFGGPVQTDRGFVLHAPVGGYSSSIKLGDVALTTSRDVLQDVANGKGPAKLLITLGYAGWGAGQLESEMSQNAWINVDASSDILFETPAENRYQVALGKLGIDPIMLAGEAGHA